MDRRKTETVVATADRRYNQLSQVINSKTQIKEELRQAARTSITSGTESSLRGDL